MMDALEILNALHNLPWEIRDQLIFCRFCGGRHCIEAPPFCRKCGRKQNLLPLAQQLLPPELYEEVRFSSDLKDREQDHQMIHKMIRKFRQERESGKTQWQFCDHCGQMIE